MRQPDSCRGTSGWYGRSNTFVFTATDDDLWSESLREALDRGASGPTAFNTVTTAQDRGPSCTASSTAGLSSAIVRFLRVVGPSLANDERDDAVADFVVARQP